MAIKTIKGSAEFANAIKQRRNEFNLTIEEAASKAKVGMKTWSRYESGESIRKDKAKGVLKALKWSKFPEVENDNLITLEELKNDEAWSVYLAENYGEYAAASFAIGIDILLDGLSEDLGALSSMPVGSHIGQLDVSWMEILLPKQFVVRYDYDFLHALLSTATTFRAQAAQSFPIVAHSVIEEIVLYMIVEESRELMEVIERNPKNEDELYEYDDWDSWAFDIFGDMDVVTFLYSNFHLTSDDLYHFDRWLTRQFY